MSRLNFRVWLVDVQEFQYFGFYEDGSYIGPCSLWRNKTPIQRSTGLKDRNDIEIYEGDIIRYKDTNDRYEIIYSKEDACFYRVNNELFNNTQINDKQCNNFLEVIGNIYQNKELLKE